MAKICIIEDDPALREELARHLGLQGHECTMITEFEDVAQHAIALHPDCAVLDLTLPGASGLEICRDIKAASSIPVIILTSSDSEFDEVMGMNLGADAYLSKPYRPAVLMAHIDAAMRRTSNASTPSRAITYAGVTLDPVKGAVEYEGASCVLARNSIHILGLLMSHAGQVISRQELMRELWESDAFVDDNTLTVNVNRLRHDLASIGVPEGFLKTERGRGYVVC